MSKFKDIVLSCFADKELDVHGVMLETGLPMMVAKSAIRNLVVQKQLFAVVPSKGACNAVYAVLAPGCSATDEHPSQSPGRLARKYRDMSHADLDQMSASEIAKKAMRLIEKAEVSVGIFVLASQLLAVPADSRVFKRLTGESEPMLIGVYDDTIDYRDILADAAWFVDHASAPAEQLKAA